MKTNASSYSLKVWLTSVAIAPIAYLIKEFCFRHHISAGIELCLKEILGGYALMIFFGGVFSLFTWLFFYLTIAIILVFYVPDKQIKYVIAILGIIFTVATFWLLIPEGLQPNSEIFPYMLANSVCNAGGALFYDLKINAVQDAENMTM